MNNKSAPQTGIEADISEWLEALENIRDCYGDDGIKTLLDDLNEWSRNRNIPLSEDQFNSPYLNTIPVSAEPDYPGDIDLEKSIENMLRWNAMAMVLQGQDSGSGVGGHIATYASAATMMEVGFNHIFRKRSANYGGDLIIPQPHTSPGVYARSWLEGRLDTTQLKNYRRELQPQDGRQGLVLHRRWRNRRAGSTRHDKHRSQGKTGQPRPRCKLQSAETGWAGTRKRQDYSGARGIV